MFENQRKNPFFSIIVPVYNIEKYINRCINSILCQTFEDYELILVDDGSTDSSGDICDTFAQNHTKVVVIHKDNGGLVSARKAGIMVASGDYICNIDGDDFIEKNFLNHFFHLLVNNTIDIIAFNYVIYYDNPKITNSISKNEWAPGFYCDNTLAELKEALLYDEKLKYLNYGPILNSLWSKVVKRTLIKPYQLLIPNSISLGEDMVLVAILCEHCSSLLVDNYYGYNYVQREGSIIHNKNYKKENVLEIFHFLKQETRIPDKNITYAKIRTIIQLLSSCATYETFQNFKVIFISSFVSHIKRIKKIQFDFDARNTLKWFLLRNNQIFLFWILIKAKNKFKQINN